MSIKTSVSRVPFRISFFGGGTDFKEWYQEHPTSVISTSINLYSFVTIRQLLPLYDHKIRLRYYKREEIQSASDIQHPTVKNVLELMDFRQSIEIVHYADLPARSGVGSSSTFSVGLIHALADFTEKKYSKIEMAKTATYVEQELNKEFVGCQDQIAVACGGFNRIDFSSHGAQVNAMKVTEETKNEFQKNLMLFFLGGLRSSGQIIKDQVSRTKQNSNHLRTITEIAKEADSLFRNGNLDGIGTLLNHSWNIKKRLSNKISSSKIDQAYNMALNAGALGGKLLGAGGGGFLLLYANSEFHSEISSRLSPLKQVHFKFDETGSSILNLQEKHL